MSTTIYRIAVVAAIIVLAITVYLHSRTGRYYFDKAANGNIFMYDTQNGDMYGLNPTAKEGNGNQHTWIKVGGK
jgi:hypothetical protein